MNRATVRYLRCAVLGKTEHQRRAPRRRTPGRGPVRDWKFRAWIRTLPCAVCGCAPSEAAHTGSDGGMRLKASDLSCVPLCTICHTGGQQAYHRLGREAFEAAHGLNFGELVERLNAAYKLMRAGARWEW
jgi:hypothetical protein